MLAAGLAAAAITGPTTSGAAPGRPVVPAAPTGAAQDPADPADPEAQEGGGTSLKADYDEIIGRETELLARIDASRAEQTRLNEALTKLQLDVRAKEVELFEAQVDVQEAEAAAAAAAEAREAAERRAAEAEERLRQQIVASYVSGGDQVGVAEAILRANNGADASNVMAYSRAIVGDSDRLVEELEAAQAARRKADRDAKAARRDAQTRRDEVAEVTAFLAAARDRQVQLVADVNAQVAAETEALDLVKGQKAKIEGQIASMNRSSDGVQQVLAQFQAGQPDWKPGDVLITNPLPGVSVGSRFGQRKHPILGIVRLHAGNDMGAPTGKVIYAPADGIVVTVGVRGGYGNTTVIDHGFSLGTLYAHQSRIDVTAGQYVKRGDPIGLVGNTGGLSTGPHLHFETRLKGVPTDPSAIVDFTRPPVSYQAEFEEEQRRLEEERRLAEGQPGG